MRRALGSLSYLVCKTKSEILNIIMGGWGTAILKGKAGMRIKVY